MLWILLAAAAPQPITPPRASLDPRALFTADDYPAEALRRHESGTVIARLVIDPLGKVESCSIGYSSKSESLDHATCQILQRRARFKPAKDDSGTAVIQ